MILALQCWHCWAKDGKGNKKKIATKGNVENALIQFHILTYVKDYRHSVPTILQFYIYFLLLQLQSVQQHYTHMAIRHCHILAHFLAHIYDDTEYTTITYDRT